ncbi:hypothetical protein DSO57_1016778 [Entomophthora muscae]|uniref:Uncharacterized protein n=1 Tax=Entomophthora muscae TaxID=34485 RepID=A0ACC2U346_9FUNG|nr:hypothetical protein DSO57_1016778 [Entomophthora muscae]
MRRITSSSHHGGDNNFKIFYLLEDLPTQAQGLLDSEENVVKSLTCDDIDLFAPESALEVPTYIITCAIIIPEKEFPTTPHNMPLFPVLTPSSLPG